MRHYGVIADTTVMVRGRSKRRPAGGLRPLRSVLEIAEDSVTNKNGDTMKAPPFLVVNSGHRPGFTYLPLRKPSR
jgi:hypothetical protein